MPMGFNAGISSPANLRHVHQHANEVNQNAEKLASGLRVNKAMDDPSAIVSIAKMSSEVDEFSVLEQNALQGLSFTETAESAVGSINDALVRMKDLAITSGNGMLSEFDRENLQREFMQMQDEIERVISTAEYNGQELLSSDLRIAFQVGSGSDTVELNIPSTAEMLDEFGVNQANIDSLETVDESISSLDSAIAHLAQLRAEFGAVQSRLESSVENNQNARIETQQSLSRVQDADMAKTMSQNVASTLQQQSAMAVQTMMNQTPPESMINQLLK